MLKPLMKEPGEDLPFVAFCWGKARTFRGDSHWFAWLALPSYGEFYDIRHDEERPGQRCLLWQSGIGFRVVHRFQ